MKKTESKNSTKEAVKAKKPAAGAAKRPAAEKKTVNEEKKKEKEKEIKMPSSSSSPSPSPSPSKGGYDDQSITMLQGPDRVRKRPSIVFGSDGLEGCKQGFFEILANAIDEANAGYGKEIIATVYTDHSMQVEDFGRGVPLGYNAKEGRWNWELVFCELFAGGKMDNTSGAAAYKTSLGTNGVGACATQYASTYMNVDSFDGKTDTFIRFEKGFPVTELETRELSRGEARTGTVISWMPDLEVFTDINIPADYFRDVLHRQAAVNYGVKFVLKLEQDNGRFLTEEFFYPGDTGLSGYVGELTGGQSLTDPYRLHMTDRGHDREDKADYDLEADISFCFTQVGGIQEYYHNSSWLEHGGSPERAVRSAFLSSLDKLLRTAGKYNKTEQKLTYADITDSLVIVISSHSTVASYENQTKKAINNEFIQSSLTEFLKKQLDIYFIEHPNDADRVANQLIINKRSRENAEKTRIDIKKKLTGSLDISNRVEKFVNCRSKDPEQRELYIVEGDSALTSCKLGRAAEFQAIIPVRGKTLNCMKSDYKQIFESDIIVDLLRVIGCGVELDKSVKVKKGDIATFDRSALRWSKIIICTDADEDGFQIRTLLLTLFYRLLPTLLREKKVFIAESPLFEITSKDETYFAYNENEKTEILKKLGDKKYTIQRSKGLGENEPEMMWQTTMNPATRRLIAVTPSDPAATEEIFDTLLGNNLPARKQFIAENAKRYMKDADI